MIFCRHFLTALVAALASAILPHLVLAEEPSATDAAMTSRIEAMIPKLEAYSTSWGWRSSTSRVSPLASLLATS